MPKNKGQVPLPGQRPAMVLVSYLTGNRIAEVLEVLGDKSKIRIWDGAKCRWDLDKKGQVLTRRVLTSKLMGAPMPTDTRLPAIEAWYADQK